MEGAAVPNFFGVPVNGKRPENFSTLNQHFGNILSVADSGDVAPTTQATAAYRELKDSLEKLVAQWTKMGQQELVALNAELTKAGLMSVDANKPLSKPPADDPDGDDEP